MNRLAKQMAFLREIDRLKQVQRRSLLLHEDRWENSAEHSWHVAMAVWVLAEHANEPVDVCRVVGMMLLHDIVEIDAGDTFVYDEAAMAGKSERERRAAERLFGLLPEDQARQFRDLWDEFEAGETAEARFAAAVDRLLPVTHNHGTGGKSWRMHGVEKTQVLRRNAPMAEGSEALWQEARRMIEASLPESPD